MKFENRLVLSAIAGKNNAEFCKKQKAALVVLGGFNADEESMKAARKIVEGGREEFIFDNPLEGIEREVKKLGRRNFALNIRSSTIEGYLNAAEIAAKHGGIIEINAHCRQRELIEARCGEWLLFNHEELLKIVRKTSEIALTAVKIRGSHKIDYAKLCEKLKNAGCKIIHVDAMVKGGGCDYELISKISKICFTIGNNSFFDIYSGEKIIKSGAKMASAARAVLKDPDFFEKMLSSPILSQPLELE